jgi:hypothetical protein
MPPWDDYVGASLPAGEQQAHAWPVQASIAHGLVLAQQNRAAVERMQRRIVWEEQLLALESQMHPELRTQDPPYELLSDEESEFAAAAENTFLVSELAVAECFLNYLRVTADSVLRALLDAPLDDEPETEEERCAVQAAREELARGKVRTLEEVRREMGL